MDRDTKQVYDDLTKDRKKKEWKPSDLVSTGSTLLDCAISNSSAGGILPGEIIVAVGASSAGKTSWYMQALAEICNDPRFDEYDIYGDDSEGGNLFDRSKIWGKKLADRLKPPRKKDGKPIYSETIEDMVDVLDDLCNKDRPFVFVEDSVDALLTRNEQETYLAQKKARRKGGKEPGSYGTDKPKRLRAALRMIRHKIRRIKAIIILVFQEQAKIGYGSNAESWSYSGGTAPKFFANLEMRFQTRKTHIKDVGGVKMDQGIQTRIKITKNRLTGRKRTIEIPFYYESGFDDIGSCVDWLVAIKYWKKKGGKIDAHDLDLLAKKGSLVNQIEDGNMEQDLKMIVEEVWQAMEKKHAIKRKKRYQ